MIVFSWVLFSSCERIDDPKKSNISASGVYILNEGNFGSGNGDVSFFSMDSLTMVNNLSLSANGFSVGDIVQDMLICDSIAIVVVNNSNKLRVFKLNTFEWIKDILLEQPRFIVRVTDSLAYVSSWLGEIRILNLNALELTGSISVGGGPEGMVLAGVKVYVAISPGNDFVGNTNSIKVISILNHSVIKTIRVGWNPVRNVYHQNKERVLVACAGKDYVSPKVPGGIYVLSVMSDELVDSIVTVNNGSYLDTLFPGRIAIRDNIGFFISGYYGSVQKFDPSTLAINDTLDGFFYNVAINTLDADDRNVYCTDATSLPGKFKIYDESLKFVDEFTVGDFPSGIVFRKSN